MSKKLLTPKNTTRGELWTRTKLALVRSVSANSGATLAELTIGMASDEEDEEDAIKKSAVRKALACAQAPSSGLPTLGAVVERIVLQPGTTHVYFSDGSVFESSQQTGLEDGGCGCGGSCGGDCDCGPSCGCHQ